MPHVIEELRCLCVDSLTCLLFPRLMELYDPPPQSSSRRVHQNYDDALDKTWKSTWRVDNYHPFTSPEAKLGHPMRREDFNTPSPLAVSRDLSEALTLPRSVKHSDILDDSSSGPGVALQFSQRRWDQLLGERDECLSLLQQARDDIFELERENLELKQKMGTQDQSDEEVALIKEAVESVIHDIDQLDSLDSHNNSKVLPLHVQIRAVGAFVISLRDNISELNVRLFDEQRRSKILEDRLDSIADETVLYNSNVMWT